MWRLGERACLHAAVHDYRGTTPTRRRPGGHACNACIQRTAWQLWVAKGTTVAARRSAYMHHRRCQGNVDPSSEASGGTCMHACSGAGQRSGGEAKPRGTARLAARSGVAQRSVASARVQRLDASSLRCTHVSGGSLRPDTEERRLMQR